MLIKELQEKLEIANIPLKSYSLNRDYLMKNSA